jgi:hypothetical protein
LRICHVISMDNMLSMGEITRQIFTRCEGQHFWININDTIPNADIYLLHCFKNPLFVDAFRCFEKTNRKAKVISLIHSSNPCRAAECSDIVVTITAASRQEQLYYFNQDSVIIEGFMDLTPYLKEQIDYDNCNFGRVSRYVDGKFHRDFMRLTYDILEDCHDSRFILTTNEKVKNTHKRFEVRSGIKIHETQRKINVMKDYSIYADIHDINKPFVETFNIAMLEAMAIGQAVIILGLKQPAMVEVLGDAGIICYSVNEWRKEVKNLIDDKEKRAHYGQKARERSKLFSSQVMIPKWNQLFRSLTNV